MNPEILKLGDTEVRLYDGGLTVTVIDGVEIPAKAENTDEYRENAKRYGYNDDIDLFSREHEIGHTLLSIMSGLKKSPTLSKWSKGDIDKYWRCEESAVLGYQSFCRTHGLSILNMAREFSA